MVAKEGKRRSTANVLAIVIPASLAVAVAVVLVLVLGKEEAPETKSGYNAGQDMLQTYEAIKEEAEKALDEMEELESEEAASDPETYEQ